MGCVEEVEGFGLVDAVFAAGVGVLGESERQSFETSC
jgi:hypothetical protein